jgi:hypothetical protein
MPEPELVPRKLESWFGVLMTPDPKHPNAFSGEPCPGVRFTEVLHVQNHRAQGKRRGEDWSVTIYVTLPASFGMPATEIKGWGFDSDRAGARAQALSNLNQQLKPLIQNLEFLGLLPKMSTET